MLAAIKDNQSLTETGPIDPTTVLKTPQDLKNDFCRAISLKLSQIWKNLSKEFNMTLIPS